MINPFFLKLISNPEVVLEDVIQCAVRKELKALIPLPRDADEIIWLNRTEASEFLKISLTKLYYLQKDGSIQYYRLGKKIYFKKDELLSSLTSAHSKTKGGVR